MFHGMIECITFLYSGFFWLSIMKIIKKIYEKIRDWIDFCLIISIDNVANATNEIYRKLYKMKVFKMMIDGLKDWDC
jgi:hypothetical protein